MANRKDEDAKVREPLEKVANLLALLLTKDGSAGDQIVVLAAAGFTNQEIADLTGSSKGTVAQTLYMARKTKARKKSKSV